MAAPSPTTYSLLKEQGKEAPPVKEFPGIRVTADGISQLNKGSLAMIDGSKKLEAGTLELKTGISQVRQQGNRCIQEPNS
jgi:X-X-X-Leu-X-X-Gly heptad repeat protein